MLASRVLQLINDARARGARCGERAFGPAPPVKLSGTLADVAFGMRPTWPSITISSMKI
jgi:hypothetical protein